MSVTATITDISTFAINAALPPTYLPSNTAGERQGNLHPHFAAQPTSSHVSDKCTFSSNYAHKLVPLLKQQRTQMQLISDREKSLRSKFKKFMSGCNYGDDFTLHHLQF